MNSSRHILDHIIWRGLYFFSVLLINIVIARFFQAEKTGQLFFIVNNLAFILLLVSLSLESGITFYISNGTLHEYLVARFCAIWSLVAACMAAGIWMVVLYVKQSDYLHSPGFLLSSFLFILGVLLTTYYTALFYSRKQFGVPNKILFALNTVLLLCIIGFRNNEFFRNRLMTIYFISFFLQGILLMIFFFSRITRPVRDGMPSQNILKKVFQYSIIALLANAVYFLVNRVDYWLVKQFCSPLDLGNYIQASRLAQMLFIIPGIFASTLFPIFSSKKTPGDFDGLARATRVLFFLNGLICAGAICFGWLLFPEIFGSSFKEMYGLFILMIPGILAVTINYPLISWFSAANKININIGGSVLAFIVILVGDIVLLPRLGVRAASIISSTGYICYYLYVFIQFHKVHTFNIKELLIIQRSDFVRLLNTVRNKQIESTI